MKNYAVIMKTSWGSISEVDNYNPDTSLEFCEEKSLLKSLKSNSRIISDSMHLTVRFASLRCFIDARNRNSIHFRTIAHHAIRIVHENKINKSQCQGKCPADLYQ